MGIIPATSGVYKIVCIPTGKVYIGSSEDLASRWRKHRASLRSNRHENQYLQNAWNKYGEPAFVFSVIELVLLGFCREREQYWLDSTKSYNEKNGFNIGKKADAPMTGRKHTPESKAKMSKASTGYRHTPETRQKMSDQNRGKIFGVQTENSRRKRAEASRGRKHSPETKEKIRQARLQNNAATSNWIVTDPDGHEIHISNLSRFCEVNNLSRDRMQQVSKTGGKYQGWMCRHAD